MVRGPTGEAYYFVSVVEDITERKLRELAFGSLTSREREVVALMARDYSNAEVAERLHLSLPTVKTHVRHVLVKLGVKDRREFLRSHYYAGGAGGGNRGTDLGARAAPEEVV